MGIAHVRAIFPLHYAGTEIVCYHALSLAALGHEITAYTAKFNGEIDQSTYGFGIK